MGLSKNHKISRHPIFSYWIVAGVANTALDSGNHHSININKHGDPRRESNATFFNVKHKDFLNTHFNAVSKIFVFLD